MVSKKISTIFVVSACFMTTPALAMEDLNWTGFHVAAGIGYGMFKQNSYLTEASVPITDTEAAGGKGWLGRLSLGYNYQLPNCFVIGAFADYDFMGVRGRHDAADIVGREKQTGAWYLGGLIGYPFTPLTLVFIDVGYVGTHFDKVNYDSVVRGETFAGSITLPSHTYNGWFFGLGMETFLATYGCSDFFLRTEYRYSGYGTANLPLTIATPDAGIGDAGIRSRLSGQTAIISLSWMF